MNRRQRRKQQAELESKYAKLITRKRAVESLIKQAPGESDYLNKLKDKLHRIKQEIQYVEDMHEFYNKLGLQNGFKALVESNGVRA
jgi:GTP1/Obg family GTP-binding protein